MVTIAMDTTNSLSFDDPTLREKIIDSKKISVKEYLASGNFGQVHKGKLQTKTQKNIVIFGIFHKKYIVMLAFFETI